MARIFTHPDGTLNPYPFTKEEARRIRAVRYDDHETCDTCRDAHDTRTSIKYTYSDRCIHCARIEAINFYNLTIGKACRVPISDGMVVALDLCNGDNHADMQPCAKAGHLGVRTPTGACWFCEDAVVDSRARAAARRKKEPQYHPVHPCPDCGDAAPRQTQTNQCTRCSHDSAAPSPRKIAQRKGDLWYTPDTPCIHCGQKALKRVNNGACQGCNPKREPAAQLPADTILTRADAKLLALKMYRTGRPCHQGHTGFRYTSTGGCVACTNRAP